VKYKCNADVIICGVACIFSNPKYIVKYRLLEYLGASLRWILHYAKKYNIPLPEQDKINEILQRTMSIADKLP
jgi:hypothetical protein